MSILLKFTYRFNTIPMKIPKRPFFNINVDKIILKFIYKGRGARIAKTFEKEE